jgi:hypothetical protein
VRYSAQRRLNVYAEARKDGDRQQVAWYGTAGLTLFGTSFGDTPVRGLHQMGDYLYAVHRGTLYQINNAGTATSRGTLSTTSGRVDMADDGTYLVAVDGTDGYTFHTGTNAFAVIPDADFPNTCNTCGFIAGRILVDKAGTGQFYAGASYNPVAWDATDFATAESSPDDLVRVFVDGGEIILFGSKTTEYWGNTGAADFPFGPVQGATVEWGLAARWSVARLGNSVAYLASNRLGQVQVVLVTGYAPRVISDADLETKLNRYTVTGDASAFSYLAGGHAFYQLNFPTAGKSWLYDLTMGLWSELEYGTEGARHRCELGTNFNGRTIAADYETGQLYEIDIDAYTDNGTVIAREMRSRHVFDENPITVRELWLDMETGIGLEGGTEPQVMLQLSKDGGHSWGHERWCSAGAIGEYSQRVVYRRLGASEDFVIKVRMTEPCKLAVMGAWMTA